MRWWTAWWLVIGSAPGCLWISAEQHALRQDADRDGVPADEDCNDADPDVSPRSREEPCDAVDNDCNPLTPDGPAYVAGPGGITIFTDVQAAIDASIPPEVVTVCPVTVRQRLRFDRAGLALSGIERAPARIDVSGMPESGPVIEVTAPDVVLSRIEVTGGTGRELSEAGLPPGLYGGGILALESEGQLTLRSVKITGNSADFGGGIAADQLTVESSEVSGNSATRRGGGIGVTGWIRMDLSRVSGNSAVDGGGIDVQHDVVVTLDEDTTLEGNTATRGGGMVVEPGATVTGGIVSGNEATEAGGGLYVDGAEVSGTEIRGNAAARGGGLYGHGTLERIELSENTADDGGGIYTDGDLTGRRVGISGNVAAKDGGGVLVGSGTLSLDQDVSGIRSGVSGNEARSGWGGGIAAGDGSLELAHTDLFGNTARTGGGVAIRDAGLCPGCRFRIEYAELSSNSATTDGGGLWSDRPLIALSVDLSDNTAGGAGAGMYLAADAELADLALQRNASGADGGGLMLDGCEAALDEGLLSYNEAGGRGAAIMLRGDQAPAAVAISGVDVLDNTAISSGAVALTPTGAHFESSGSIYARNLDHDIEIGGAGCSVTGLVEAFSCDGGGGDLCDPASACE